MTPQWLALLADGDDRALAGASPSRHAALPSVRALLAAERAVVRALALRCVAQIDPAIGAQTALECLDDEDVFVQVAALALLQARPWSEPLETWLLRAVRDDERASAPLAATLLVHGDPARVGPALLGVWRRCRRLDVQREVVTTLAILGDEHARSAWCEVLTRARDEELLSYLQTARRRLGATWVLPPLCALLERTEKLQYIGVDGVATGVRWLRTCDVALPTAVEIAGLAPPFVCDRVTNFSPEQRAYVHRAALEVFESGRAVSPSTTAYGG